MHEEHAGTQFDANWIEIERQRIASDEPVNIPATTQTKYYNYVEEPLVVRRPPAPQKNLGIAFRFPGQKEQIRRRDQIE